MIGMRGNVIVVRILPISGATPSPDANQLTLVPRAAARLFKTLILGFESPASYAAICLRTTPLCQPIPLGLVRVLVLLAVYGF